MASVMGRFSAAWPGAALSSTADPRTAAPDANSERRENVFVSMHATLETVRLPDNPALVLRRSLYLRRF